MGRPQPTMTAGCGTSATHPPQQQATIASVTAEAHNPPQATPPDSEGDDPEGVNGGLGELVSVNAKDRAADLLAERIDGKASVRFAKGPPNEFDAVSADYGWAVTMQIGELCEVRRRSALAVRLRAP
jgi:hypothetical protein